MTAESLAEVVAFLEGAYARIFPSSFVTVAHGLFRDYPDRLVQQAAVALVDSGEAFPSPAKLLQHVKTIHAEAVRTEQIEYTSMRTRVLAPPAKSRSVARVRQPEDTDEARITYLRGLIGASDCDGTAGREECLEFIGLLLARQYPIRAT